MKVKNLNWSVIVAHAFIVNTQKGKDSGPFVSSRQVKSTQWAQEQIKTQNEEV